MGKQFFILIFALLFHCLLSNALIYEDMELNSIVIDESVEFDPNIFDPSESQGTIIASEDGPCVTTSGASGRCMYLDECFRFANIFMASEQTSIESFNEHLLSVVNSTATDFCTSDKKQICCPRYNYGLASKKPPKKTMSGCNVPEISTTTTPPSTDNGQTCGGDYEKSVDSVDQNGNETRVVGGMVANPGDFPWMAALISGQGQQFCGGSLISSTFVLTAAHCVAENSPSLAGMRVLLGAHDLSDRSEKRESRNVVKMLYHAGFSMRHLMNDVALIQLSSPVQFTRRIQPICLNSRPVDYSKQVDLAGWGKTSKYGGPSSQLRTVKMPLRTPEECKGDYESVQGAPPLTDGNVCAGQYSPLKDSCNGDSGGPLSYVVDGKATQVGIVSWGINCGEKLGVYTNVQKYLSWITKNSR